MAADKPGGGGPRPLETEVAIQVETDRPDTPTGVEEAAQTQPTQTQDADNTASTTPSEDSSEVQEQLSNRAEERIQSLSAQKREAEQRAAYFENVVRSMVQAPVQPTATPEDQLAKQFKSYDLQLGYPTDPKEYAAYNAQVASKAAEQAALRVATQALEQQEIAELQVAYPDADDEFLGAVAAAKSAAARQGQIISYKQAAEIATKKLEKRFTRQATAKEVTDMQEKNSAYVESTKGASASRSPETTPDPDQMSIDELEAYLRKTGNW